MMPIKNWSPTAASNNSAPPNGAPEGMFASAVNDVIRQIMADVRGWYEAAEWIDRGDGPTYASGTTFTLSDDLTGPYHANRRIRATGSTTGTIYGTIESATYSAPTTTVTVEWDSGTLQNETLAASLSIISATNPSVAANGIDGLGSLAALGFLTDHFTTASGSLSLVAGAIGSDEISDSAVTAAKLSLAGVITALEGEGAAFPSGTEMLFVQASAPTGWTQTTTWNDRVLRVVNDAGGGSTGGSWTLSGLTVEGHVLTIDEMPSHTHPYTVPSGIAAGNLQRGDTAEGGNAENRVTSSTGGGGSHDHDLTADASWRPAYLDVIVAAKD